MSILKLERVFMSFKENLREVSVIFPQIYYVCLVANDIYIILLTGFD